MKLVEHKEMKCPNCGCSLNRRIRLSIDDPDFGCNECGKTFDLIW